MPEKRFRRLITVLLACGLVLAAGCGRKHRETVSDVERAGKSVAEAARGAARQAGDAARDAAEKAKTATDDLLARVKNEMGSSIARSRIWRKRPGNSEATPALPRIGGSRSSGSRPKTSASQRGT